MRWRRRVITQMSFSNDQRTVSSIASNGRISTAAFLPNKKNYVEFEVISTAASIEVGLTQPTWQAGSSAGYTGIQDTSCYGFVSNGTNVTAGGAGAGTVTVKATAAAVGDRFCMAIDVPNELVWTRVNNGLWNNSGSADPATGTGGVSIASLDNTQLVLAWLSTAAANAGIKINAGQEAFVQTAPSGFTAPTSDEAMDFIGWASGTTSATIPTHQAGDLILGFAFRDGSTTLPTIPGGVNWTTEENAAGANTCGSVLVSKVAAGSSETTGTFTNATAVLVGVWRPRSGYTLATGASNTNSGSGTTVTYSALTLNSTAGKSIVAAFAAHRSTDTSVDVLVNTGSGGLGEYGSFADATNEAGASATQLGATANFSVQNVSVGGTSSGWRTHVIEITAASTGITGTGAATLGLTASASGVHGVAGTAAATLGMGASAAGARGVAGTASATFGLTASATGVFGGSVGSGAAQLQLSASASGAHGVAGLGSAVLHLTGLGQGLVIPAVVGAGAATLPITAEAIGQGPLWGPVAPSPETWTGVPSEAGDWTARPATPETWTPVSANSETWTPQ